MEGSVKVRGQSCSRATTTNLALLGGCSDATFFRWSLNTLLWRNPVGILTKELVSKK